jgi:arsenite transporter
MSAPASAATAPAAGMNVFERYLAVLVGLCIVAGIALGRLFPAPVQAVGSMEITLATVVGVLIEVPVILLVVRVANASRGWYERADPRL